MTASNPYLLLERLIGDLTDAALDVVLRAGPKQNSIDVELNLGRQIDAHVRQAFRYQRWLGGLTTPASLEQFLSRLANAAYQVALSAGVRFSFLDLELGIWNSFRRVAEGTNLRCLFDQFSSARNAAMSALLKMSRVGRISPAIRESVATA